jgi:hypothetical protein
MDGSVNLERENLLLEDLFRVKYIKLHFRIEMLEDTVLPVQKASALRGGMGEMLLRANCVRDRDCESCEFEPECIVRRVMYSKMRIRPAFMSNGDSVGYVINCENYEEHFRAGDTLDFDLLLFGRMVVYFGQILQALQYLGYFGLGKNLSHFQIVEVTNSRRERIMDGNDIYMSRLDLMSIGDYVAYRKKDAGSTEKLVFHTPLTLKEQGEFLKDFDIAAVIRAIERRLYMLNCYEGIEVERRDFSEQIPLQTAQKSKNFSVHRYSNHHEQKICLSGICGDLTIENADEEIQELLLAGELIHIGKNTSFGFGRYSVMKPKAEKK